MRRFESAAQAQRILPVYGAIHYLLRGLVRLKPKSLRPSRHRSLTQDFHFDPGTATVYTHAARIPRLSALNPAHQLRRQAPKPVRPLTDVDGTG